MSNKKWMKGLWLLALWMPWAAYAGEMEKARFEAGWFEADLARAMLSTKTQIVEDGIGGARIMPPRPLGKDALDGIAECGVVDAKFFGIRQVSLRDAVRMLKPCMEAVSRKYRVAVSAAEAVIAKGPHIMGGVPGVGVYVSGPLPLGSTVLVDLRYGIEILRRGHILGHPAKVELLGEIRPQASSLQNVLNRCILPMYVSPIVTSQDFVDTYGWCLKQAPGLKITGVMVPPDRHVPLNVWVFSRASQDVVQAMSGEVVVAGDRGQVKVRIWAYYDTPVRHFGPADRILPEGPHDQRAKPLDKE